MSDATKIRIGRVMAGPDDRGPGFALPVDVQTKTIAVLGIRGSGKTNTAGVIAEGVLERDRQAVIIDPTGVWWGLRSSADGKRPGLPIIVAGGLTGDVPLTADDGRTLADFAVEHRASMVLSLRHLRKADQRRFVTDFAEQLYHRKGASRGALLVVIDECDAFIPQRVSGAEARMVGAIEDLVRRGRSAGIGVCLISQRAASINKDVLTQVEMLVSHRHTSPQDRNALEEWVEAHDTADRAGEFMKSLAALPRGAAWFWSPGWLDVFERVQVQKRKTFDSSATPDDDAPATAATSRAAVDLDALRIKLAKTIEIAEANDPRKLKARIAELEAELRAGKAPTPAPIANTAELVALRTRIAEHEKREAAYCGLALSVISNVSEIGNAIEYARGIATRCAKAVVDEAKRAPKPLAPLATAPSPPTSTAPIKQFARAVIANAHAQATAAPTNGQLPRAESKILAAAVQCHPRPATRTRLSVLSGYAQTSSSFDNALGSLRTRGYLDGRGDDNRATPAGIAAAGAVEPMPTGTALVEFWKSRLAKAERTMLDALARAGRSLTRAELSEATGYSAGSSSFDNALGKLRSLGLIEGRGDDNRLSGEAFGE